MTGNLEQIMIGSGLLSAGAGTLLVFKILECRQQTEERKNRKEQREKEERRIALEKEKTQEVERRFKLLSVNLSADEEKRCRVIIKDYVEHNQKFHQQYVLNLLGATDVFIDATPQEIFDEATQLLTTMNENLSSKGIKVDIRKGSNASKMWKEPEITVKKILMNLLPEAFISDWQEAEKANEDMLKHVANRWVYICKGLVSAQVQKSPFFTELRDGISEAVQDAETIYTTTDPIVSEEAANRINTAAKNLEQTLDEVKKDSELGSFLDFLQKWKTLAEDHSVDPDKQSSTFNLVDTLIISVARNTYDQQKEEKEKDTKLKAVLGSYIFTGIQVDSITDATRLASRTATEFGIGDPQKLLQILKAANDYLSEISATASSEFDSRL